MQFQVKDEFQIAAEKEVEAIANLEANLSLEIKRAAEKVFGSEATILFNDKCGEVEQMDFSDGVDDIELDAVKEMIRLSMKKEG